MEGAGMDDFKLARGGYGTRPPVLASDILKVYFVASPFY